MRRCNKLLKAEVSQERESSPPWSKLPQEILAKIAIILESEGPSEKCRFQQVCKAWYVSSLPSTLHLLYNNLPLKIPKIFPDSVHSKNPNFLVGTSVFLVQPLNQPSTQPWLVSLEEFNPGKLRIHAPLSKKPITNLPLNFPKGLNLSGFRVSLIHEGLKIGFENVVGLENVRYFGPLARTKVLLVTIDGDLCDGNCVAIVLNIHGYHSLSSFNLSTGGWKHIDSAKFCRFDDIVYSEGFVYAIDRNGRVFDIDVDNNEVKVGKEVTNAIGKAFAFGTRKRLAVLDEELYMINLIDLKKFEVYKLNEGLGKWDEVKCLGDKILMVTMDDIFWVDARDFLRCRGNCILFSKHCCPVGSDRSFFENQVFHGAKEYLEIGVYYLGEDCSLPISSYPELCNMISPFPSWICSNSFGDSSSSRQSNSSTLTAMESRREVKIPTEMPIASKARTSEEDIAKKVSGTPHQTNDDSVLTVSSLPKVNWAIHASGSSTRTLHGQVPKETVPEIIIPDVDSTIKNKQIVVSLEKFEGVNVSSQFVPVLQEVRNKHGNIIQGIVYEVQSDSLLLKCGLETLAQMVNILQSNSVRSLSDSDAKFLDASLHDLNFMRFNVKVIDWLVPLVRSALDHHRKNKERTLKMQELESVRSKMIDVLREVERTLAEEKKIASANLSVLPLLDIKKELS